MTVDENTTWFNMLAEVWRRFTSNRIVRAIIWARWIITLIGFLSTTLWYAYVEGQDISENLTDDYKVVQAAQGHLLDDSLGLLEDLLNPSRSVELDAELADLRTKAKKTIGALGGLRAPTNGIEQAQREYRAALEQLIAVANRIDRGEIEGIALPLHNSLQGVANAGGQLNASVRHFQGGMWPQLTGSVF